MNLAEVEIILKSLVLSNPTGLSIYELNRDFENEIGSSIPFKKFGYISLDSFLCSLNKSIAVFTKDGKRHVVAVSSSKTKHIELMISAQKKPSKRNKRTRNSMVGKQFNNSIRYKTNYSSRYGSRQRSYTSFSNNEVNNYSNRSSNNMENLKPEIKHSYSGVSSETKTIGESFDEFLSKSNNSRTYFNSENSFNSQTTNSPNTKFTSDSLKRNLESFSKFLEECNETKFSNNMERSFKLYKDRINTKIIDDEVKTNDESFDQFLKNSNKKLKSETENISEKKEDIKRQTLDQFLTCNEKIELHAENGQNNYKALSVEVDNKLLKSINRLNESESQSLALKNETSYQSAKLNENTKPSVTVTGLVNINEKSQEEKLISQENTNKITKKTTFEISSDNKTLKENKFELKSLSKITENLRPKSSLIRELSKIKSSENIQEKSEFPKYAATLQDKIEKDKIIDLELGMQFSLFISEVNNPYKFWFHAGESSKKLDELMYCIELFNKSLGDFKGFDMKLEHIRPKQLCFALYNKNWHRAEILQNPIDKKVKIYFIDYGTVDCVSVSCIRYIHKYFIETPALVFRGCLANLKPASIRWERDCTYFFTNMIYEKKLWAKLIDFDESEQIHHLIIVDTTKEIDININTCLVTQGHAGIFYNSGKAKTHFQYVYPTFEMLEKGEYASFEQVGKMLGNGFNYENEIYKTLESINTKKLFGCSTIEFWNFIRKLS